MLTADRFVRSGKVRDLYDLPDGRLLMVASDRISAFDVVLPTGIPDKGRVLTGLSRFWFAETSDIVPNHLHSVAVDDPDLRGRSMIVERVEVIPFEAVVRGFLAGSGWKGYQQTGHVCGIRLPRGLRESDRLPEPIFTPATKAEQGAHDENVSFDAMADAIGSDLARRVRRAALELYAAAIGVAARAGILIADTKFEFGVRPRTGELLLVDEVLTPDSSRFWDAAAYEPGRPQASFDKQYVRDWLEAQPWDKTAPGPELPDAIVEGTRERYIAAFERITRASFDRYLREDVIAR
ncbi:MAG TPA: phosphoribosylaminoimidazolesuccinocarboxamide synthase [Candidatus Limnocylindrales bacterium]|nr:phosphoribosylaminoimidazolesuccinocarboxamide synthase [Candidatus Limnocylindrales bacterium]